MVKPPRPLRNAVKVTLALGLLLSAGHPASANDLLQLVRLAVTRDATLQIAIDRRDAAIEARPQALAQWLPHGTADTSETRERAGYQVDNLQSSQAAACDLAATDMENCYGNVRTVGLSLSQTLWSFEAYSRLKEADFQAASAQANLLSAEQSLLLRVANAYFGILSARDQLATNRSERAAFATLLNQAKARAETGVGPRSDVEQAQSFYDATAENVIDADNILDDAELAMTEIVGAHPKEVAALRDDIPLLAPDPASVDAWVRAALRDNPGVRAAELGAEAADRGISTQRGRALPTISLTAGRSRFWQNQALGGNQSLDTIGVSFIWPLLQGGAVASAVREARALYRQAEAQVDAARLDTERRTRAAYRGVVAGIQRINAASQAVDSSRDAVEASRRDVSFGTGTEFDLLNAQNNYYAARRAYSQTRYDYLTNLLMLKQQAGSLSEHDLAAIDALLVGRGS
ncbi:MAG TPA: TolC family outer membrane protein [Steroidobacteraceae bacterium]|nr:TolC family outer membrane protein [Steroidobacteraceae bacterium]